MTEDDLKKLPMGELLDLLIKGTREFTAMLYKESGDVFAAKKNELELIQKVVDAKIAERKPA